MLLRHLDPMILGDYPKSMKDNVKERLPVFTEEENKLVMGSLDFIGVNYYTSRYAYNSPPVEPKHYLGDSLSKFTGTICDHIIIFYNSV